MTVQSHVLVVDDEPDIRGLVKEILEDEGYIVTVAENGERAREARLARRPDLILLDIWMPDVDGISLLREWSESSVEITPVVMMSGHGTVETAVEATRLGAYDFIEKPLSMGKLLLAVQRALEAARLRRENLGLRRDAGEVPEPLGRGPAMVTLRAQIERVSQHDAPMLVTGESGSGKEVCARQIHRLSNRGNGPFVRVPVGAPAQELLGTESGPDVQFGALDQANGGTLFIEEIADMAPTIQARLLGVIESGEFSRVDGRSQVSFNARIIATSSPNPMAAIEAGRLRDDLYYHLNVVPLQVPALREHPEDIPELLAYYLESLATRENLPARRFTVGAQNRLRNHHWPGNIRELKNLVHRLLILGSGADIEAQEIDLALASRPQARIEASMPGEELTLKEARDDFERRYLEHQIRRSNGSISKAAELAGVERTHLYRKLRTLGIDPKRLLPEDGRPS